MSLVASEKIETKKIETNTWKLKFSIDAAAFATAVTAVFQRQSADIVVPGFRKGKAPRALIEKRYGADVFYEEAMNDLLPAAVEEAIQAAGLEPVDKARDLDVTEMSAEAGVTGNFTVIVKPEVSVADYRGIEAPKAEVDIADAQVDARIDELRERNARTVEVEDRAAQDGDIALFDFRGLVDGVPFEGGAAENYELTLGGGQFIPGFEEQLIGHKAGEAFDIAVVFPADYGSEALAGKPAIFEIKLHALKVKELPEVDDDFAQEVGEDYNTVDDLRAGIRKELTDHARQHADEDFERALREKLAELVEGEIPPVMIEKRAQDTIEQFTQRIRMDLDTYLGYFGMDRAQYEADVRRSAEISVKGELGLEKIAALEGIAPAAEEIEAEYARLAEEYKVDIARVRTVPEKDIATDLSIRKAFDLVKDSAVAVAPPEPEDLADERTEPDADAEGADAAEAEETESAE
ncbi:MAG: trigger factor [Oscillospiraceae bacterium]|nr:trigger factor [Oscillospiraceae bacterium]